MAPFPVPKNLRRRNQKSLFIYFDFSFHLLAIRMSYGKVLRNPVAKRVLDLRSDTFTLPSATMRARMAEAVCGDDVYKEDRTIIELESRLADLTGHEGALFVLTCTMANFLGLAATCNRGEEVLCGNMSHIGLYEQSNVSQFTGIGMRQVKNQPDGTVCLDDVLRRGYFSNDDFHMSHSKDRVLIKLVVILFIENFKTLLTDLCRKYP